LLAEDVLSLINNSILRQVFIVNKISICRVNSYHSRLIWEWRNDPDSRLMSRDSDFIPWDHHEKWFQSSLADSSRYFYLLENDNIPFGLARFDLFDIKVKSYEMSIMIAPAFRGKNLSKTLLHRSLSKFNEDVKGDKIILAEVKKDNFKSNSLFLNYGFHDEGGDTILNQFTYLLKSSIL
tara:strand:+ start:163 stop:702 length:540 start_codon:yes stop_codon:yes gene_type:complete